MESTRQFDSAMRKPIGASSLLAVLTVVVGVTLVDSKVAAQPSQTVQRQVPQRPERLADWPERQKAAVRSTPVRLPSHAWSPKPVRLPPQRTTNHLAVGHSTSTRSALSQPLPQAQAATKGVSQPVFTAGETGGVSIASKPHSEQWWELAIRQRQLRFANAKSLSLTEALRFALVTAPELRALQAETVIRHYEIVRQQAAFDWTTFLDTFWNDDSNPVGDQLAGVQNRLRTNALATAIGLRQRNVLGGEFQVSQDLNHDNSNSQFFVPKSQGSSRLALEYNQPLLRGAGMDLNSAPIGLAEIDRNIAMEDLRAAIEIQLLRVAEAYLNLVVARGNFVQVRASWQRGEQIARTMENRQDIDVGKNQLIRAQATTASRMSTLVQAEYAVARAQEVLERVVFGVDYANKVNLEVLPTTMPSQFSAAISIGEELQRGLRNRPEIQRVIAEIKSAALQQEIAENEILPQLNLVLSAYSAGLRGQSNIPGAVVDQFTTGEPGYGIGLSFEYPLKNRAARAAAFQRHFAVKKLQDEFEAVVADVSLNIRDQAIANQQSTDEASQTAVALQYARAELASIETRRKYLVDGNQVADLYLEDLLQAQERLQLAELALLQAQVNRGRARVRLQRATGTLYLEAQALGIAPADFPEQR